MRVLIKQVATPRLRSCSWPPSRKRKSPESKTHATEGLDVRLTPLRIYGDLIQVRAEVTGSVARNGVPDWLSRSEQWMISRGESAALEVLEGEPPTGYRFIVTPRF